MNMYNRNTMVLITQKTETSEINKDNENEKDRLTWLTCLFNKGFSQPMCKASLSLSWKDVEAVSRIKKQSSEHKALHVSDLFMCWKMCEFLSYVNSPEHFHFWKCFDRRTKTDNYPIRAWLWSHLMRGLFSWDYMFSDLNGTIQQYLQSTLRLLLPATDCLQKHCLNIF